MPYTTIGNNRKNFTIIINNFNSVSNFDVAVNALRTIKFDGFSSIPMSIKIIRNYLSNKITIAQLIKMNKFYLGVHNAD
jgi:hypothetical protein